MKRTQIFLFVLLFFFLGCSKLQIQPDETSILENEYFGKSYLTLSQARELAKAYCSNLGRDGVIISPITKATNNVDIDSYDCYIENNDTLMFAFNLSDEKGYVLIGSNGKSFPIFAHSPKGHFSFSNIPDGSAVNLFLDSYIERIRESRQTENSGCERWQNLGKEGYEYTVTPVECAFSPMSKSNRQYSLGLDSVSPYTGLDLDNWSQEGGFSYYAENGALIGCPAIAIGMLLYDVHNRLDGDNCDTDPQFEFYYDAADISSYTTGTPTALKLRQIADAIPNYQWGTSLNASSGAYPEDIATGLNNLGFWCASYSTYTFSYAYSLMNYTFYYLQNEPQQFKRGILLGAYAYPNSVLGHIWFCDGYYEQSYLVQEKFLGIVINEWTEYDDMLYMNWGFGPNNGNGWYTAQSDYWPFSYNIITYGNLKYYNTPTQE
jgi:hypothetical protein